MQAVSLPLHSMMGTAGGLLALAIAGILVVNRHRAEDAPYLLWAASGLIAMGLLDLFHSAVSPGDNFVWLRSVANLLGGALFACVWLGTNTVPNRITAKLPWLALLISVVIGIGSILYPTAVPVMMIGDETFGRLTPDSARDIVKNYGD